jgi:CheY-like chemotaxis protein
VTPGPKSLFKFSEIARLCGVDVNTVHLWLSRGRIRPARRTSTRGYYLVPRGEVARILRQRDVEVPGLWTRPRPKPLRVVIVYDDDSARSMLRAMVRRFAAPVELAETRTVEDGLVAAGRLRPDLIVLGVTAHGGLVSPEQAVMLFRASSLKGAPILAVSVDPELRKRVLAAGATDFIDISEEIARLKEVLSRYRRKRG